MSHYTNNLHRIFVDKEIGFKKKITPTKQNLNFFNQVKKDVKIHLNTKIKEFLEQQGIANIAPKFRIQGSWAYGTCNLPAKEGQEMDFDYGVYCLFVHLKALILMLVQVNKPKITLRKWNS